MTMLKMYVKRQCSHLGLSRSYPRSFMPSIHVRLPSLCTSLNLIDVETVSIKQHESSCRYSLTVYVVLSTQIEVALEVLYNKNVEFVIVGVPDRDSYLNKTIYGMVHHYILMCFSSRVVGVLINCNSEHHLCK